MKTFRFDGTVTCSITLWIDADTPEEAHAKLAAAPGSHLSRVTSLAHVLPDKETMVITGVRESTGVNP